MIITISALVSVLLSLFAYAAIQRKEVLVEKQIHIKGLIPAKRKRIALFALLPIVLIGVAVAQVLLYEYGLLFVVKRSALLAVLFAAAVTDYDEMKIPNFLILSGLVIRVLLLAIEVAVSFPDFKASVISEAIALGATLLVCFACAFIAKGSLGMGDIKLLALMALFLGIEGIFYSVFASLLYAFLISVYLLITKKKSRKDFLPFAPFLFLGTVTSLILSGV